MQQKLQILLLFSYTTRCSSSSGAWSDGSEAEGTGSFRLGTILIHAILTNARLGRFSLLRVHVPRTVSIVLCSRGDILVALGSSW